MVYSILLGLKGGEKKTGFGDRAVLRFAAKVLVGTLIDLMSTPPRVTRPSS